MLLKMVVDSEQWFANVLGFVDYQSLCEKSEVVFEEEGDVTWYVTELPNGKWAAWDDAEVSVDRVALHDTYDEAVEYHRVGWEARDG